jgi:hypothetical protein
MGTSKKVSAASISKSVLPIEAFSHAKNEMKLNKQ